MSAPTLFTAEQLWMPGFIANPYPTYHHLRDHSPLPCMTLPAGAFAGVHAPIRLWALMTHADVSRALRDHETFVSGRSPLAGTAYPKLALIQDDPPRHTQLRRLVNQAFTPKRIAVLVPWITRVAQALLEAIDTGETHLVQAYTTPLPTQVIAHLLGIPTEEYATFKRWSDTTIDSAGELPYAPYESHVGT
jgi:cytochrome P450